MSNLRPDSHPAKEPFNVRCGRCDHIWTAAYTPMPILDFAGIAQSLRCPKCANTAASIYPTKDDAP